MAMKLPCLVPACVGIGSARGLCSSHFRLAFKLVKAGQTTWERLEATRKALPTKGRRAGLSEEAKSVAVSWFTTFDSQDGKESAVKPPLATAKK